jgi:uncharacterized protein (DUF2236 family)
MAGTPRRNYGRARLYLIDVMQDRFFSPQSKLWQVDREMALLLAGGRALLMQLAHPKIAAGVAEHSSFRDDPLGRLYRTMSAMWSIVFDQAAPARAALQRVNDIHGKVHGTVPATEPAYGGMPYDAFEQQLLLWVHATLIDTAMVAYGLLVNALPAEDKSRYYEDSKRLAQLFEIRDAIVPGSLAEFNLYMEQMLAGPALAVGPTAKALARDILYPQSGLLRPGGPLFRLITAGLLPQRLREDYEIPWDDRRGRNFRRAATGIRCLLPIVAAPLRIVPHARRAERRLRSDSPR